MSRPVRILLVAYGGGHVPMMLPVMKALRHQHPGVVLDLMALTTAYAAARNAGEKPWQFADLKHLADEDFVDEWGARLAPQQRHPDVSEEETRAYVGVNFWDLVQQHGLEAAKELHASRERFAYLPLHFFRRVLAHFKPDVVVATVSPRSEEAALQVAIEAGIPTVSMTDFYLRAFDPYCKRSVYADRVTVVNEQVRQTLEDCGVPTGNLMVTGNPAFDSLADPERRRAAQAFRERQGWHDKTVVMWAGHLDDYTTIRPDPVKATDYPLQVEAELRRWVDAADDRALIIRYHPNEMHWFPPGPAHPRIFTSTRAQHVHEAVLAADVVVVQMSTVGLEAAVAGKPVVAMVNSPHALRVNFNYEKLGVAYAAPEVALLAQVIDRALREGCVDPALARREPAAPVIAAEILSLAGRRSRI
ncbi:MAG: CDP-glycerol glycerophosphotransferase family protein [Ramlibacter sp.]